MEDHFSLAVKFGQDLIRSQDLDPVYTAMAASGFKQKEKARLLFFYSCLYHLGASARLALQPSWGELRAAARNDLRAWPRGTERRHWRAANAIATVDFVESHYRGPEAVVDYWASGDRSFQAVSGRVRELPGFGPWIAFKVADMLERVLGVPVDFTDCAFGVYDEPRKGAALLLHGDTDQAIPVTDVDATMGRLLKRLGKLKAPPDFARPINVQEVETVLCKYKSGYAGHYEPGKDTKEVLHGLRDPRWDCKPVRAMIKKLEELPYAG